MQFFTKKKKKKYELVNLIIQNDQLQSISGDKNKAHTSLSFSQKKFWPYKHIKIKGFYKW